MKESATMTQRLKVTAVLLSFAAALLAHGGMEHVTGFVKAISPESVIVETLKHETVTVRLTAKTEAMKSGVKASLKDLRTGDRVAIHAVKDQAGALEAAEVEWGPAPASAAPRH
jgi:Cu/Ag efflux protein CusF